MFLGAVHQLPSLFDNHHSSLLNNKYFVNVCHLNNELIGCVVSNNEVSRFCYSFFVVFLNCQWIIQKWYRASVWSQLKLCFVSCQGTKSGLTVNQFLFLHSRLNEVIWWMCMCFMLVRCDNSHWLTVPSLHVTVPCRHVKQNDSFTSTYFRSLLTLSLSRRSRSFEKLKISCQKVYCLVFRMRLSLHILWLMWIFRILFCSVLVYGISMYLFAYADNHLCRRQEKEELFKPQINHRLNSSWNAIILQQCNYVGMSEVRRIGFICSDFNILLRSDLFHLVPSLVSLHAVEKH